MKSKDFQAPVLFSSTFKALNLGLKNLSTFKDAWGPCLLFWKNHSAEFPVLCMMDGKEVTDS